MSHHEERMLWPREITLLKEPLDVCLAYRIERRMYKAMEKICGNSCFLASLAENVKSSDIYQIDPQFSSHIEKTKVFTALTNILCLNFGLSHDRASAVIRRAGLAQLLQYQCYYEFYQDIDEDGLVRRRTPSPPLPASLIIPYVKKVPGNFGFQKLEPMPKPVKETIACDKCCVRFSHLCRCLPIIPPPIPTCLECGESVWCDCYEPHPTDCRYMHPQDPRHLYK